MKFNKVIIITALLFIASLNNNIKPYNTNINHQYMRTLR